MKTRFQMIQLEILAPAEQVTKEPKVGQTLQELEELRQDKVCHKKNQELIDQLIKLLACTPHTLVEEVEKFREASVTRPASPIAVEENCRLVDAVEMEEGRRVDGMECEVFEDHNTQGVLPNPNLTL